MSPDQSEPAAATVTVRGKTVLLINPLSSSMQEFDKFNLVFDGNASQNKLYQLCGKELVSIRVATLTPTLKN